MTKVWDEEDNKFLMEHYKTMSNQELAEKFGVSKKSIQGKLRRLGLHRNADEEAQLNPDDSITESEEEIPGFQFRRKHLTVKPYVSSAKDFERPAYIPRELTERRKRAIRDFDSAVKILASGDKKRALEEFDFIMTTFKGEIDIIQRAQLYKYALTQPVTKEEPVLTTAEDYYQHGIWLCDNNQADSSQSYFEKALELDPEYTDAIYNLACLAARRGNTYGALDLIEQVLSMDDNLAENIAEDDDFEPLWKNPEFIELLKEHLES